MNRAVRRYMLLAAAVAIMASAIVHLVLFAYGPWARLGADVGIAQAPMEAPPLPRAEIEFTPLDERRILPKIRFIDGDGRDLSIADFRGRACPAEHLGNQVRAVSQRNADA